VRTAPATYLLPIATMPDALTVRISHTQCINVTPSEGTYIAKKGGLKAI